MDETPGIEAPPPPPSTADSDKLRKKKDKVRTAWISFFGRIVAQITGAVASVVLALLFLQRHQSGGATDTAAPTPPAAARISTRTPGVTSLVVLPLTNLSGDPQHDYFADGMTEAIKICEASSTATPEMTATEALAYFRAGQRSRAQAIIDQLRAQTPPAATPLGRWYALTGNPDAAVRVLAEAARRGASLQAIKNDPDFESIRSNPQFAELVRPRS